MNREQQRYLAEAKARFQASRAARRARSRGRFAPPDPPPRYDEGFYEIGRLLEEREGAIPQGLIVGVFATLDVVEGLMSRYGCDARLMDVRAELLREVEG